MRFSRRVSIHFTGRPRRRASVATATSSGKTCIFSPKPPPTSGAITRTCDSSSRSAVASAVRMIRGVWLEAQTVSVSPSQAATVPRGSSGEAVSRPWVKASLRTTAAPAKAASTSPRRWERRKRTASSRHACSSVTHAGLTS